jgi:hypothetical protein
MPQVRSMLQMTSRAFPLLFAFCRLCLFPLGEMGTQMFVSASASHKIKHLGFFFPSLPDGLGCRTALSRLLVSECGLIGIDLT